MIADEWREMEANEGQWSGFEVGVVEIIIGGCMMLPVGVIGPFYA